MSIGTIDKDLVENIRCMKAAIENRESSPAFTEPAKPEPALAGALKSASDGFRFSELWGIEPPTGMPDIGVTKREGVDPEVVNLIPGDEETYVPQGLNEYMFTKAMRDGARVLASGPKGSGKSTLPKIYCARTGTPFFRVQCNSALEYDDLFGNLTIRDGDVVFNDGPVTQAARYGGVACLDEASTLRAGAAMGLQWLLEKGGKIHLPTYPSANPEDKYVTPHEDFRIVLTDNTNLSGDDSGQYVGTNVQNAAFKDRIDMFIRVGYMNPVAEFSMVSKHVPEIPEAVLRDMIRFAGEIRNGFDNGSVGCTVSPRVLLRWARNTVDFGHVGFALRYTFVNSLGADDETVVATIYNKVFGEKVPV